MKPFSPTVHLRHQQHPPSPRREFQSTNGSAHDRIVGSRSPTRPNRGIKNIETPPGASPRIEARPQESVTISPSTIRTPPVGIFPNSSGRTRDNGRASGRTNRLNVQGTAFNALPHPDPISTLAGDVDSSDSSADDIVRVSGHFTRPGLAPKLLRAQFGQPPSWRPPHQAGSFHSQRRTHHQQSIRSSSIDELRSDSSSTETTSSWAGRERHRLWETVADQRLKIRDLREQLEQKRREKHALRIDKARVDNDFMQIFRPQLTSSRPMAVVAVDLIKQKFEDMQLARDNYYAIESEYENLEAELMHEEYRLQEFENELYHFLENEVHTKDGADTTSSTDESGGLYSGSDDNSDESSEDDTENDAASSITLLGISDVRHEDIHPLYAQLLDAAGDRALAKEHYDEILMHHDKILHDLEMGLHRERMRSDPGNPLSVQELETLKSSLNHIPTDPAEFRAKFGVEIDQDDLEFLRDYKVEEERVRSKLEESSGKVERLVTLCREKGALRKNAPYDEDHAIYSGSNWASSLPEGNVDIEPYDGRAGDLSHPRFSILLSNRSHVLKLLSPLRALEQAMAGPIDNPTVAQRRAECMKELGIENLMKKPENKPDFINQWLIHRLRTSPLEVELMFSIFEESFKIRNIRRWQEDVLYYWRQDAAASRLAEDFNGPITSRDGLESSGSIDGVNSAVLASVRVRSEVSGHSQQNHHSHDHYELWKRGSGPSAARSLP